MNNYILVTGAPGSKWSSVVKNIYQSIDIDNSDYSEERTYWHEADTPGTPQLMHIGAYWDPGMEFDIHEWDAPFSGQGIRIIKSHTFAHQLDRLKEQDKGPIVMVYRNDYECYKWWQKCGEFNITYPLYNEYYKDLNIMWIKIQNQNRDIIKFIKDNSTSIVKVTDNYHLAEVLQISKHGIASLHEYYIKDIQVYVYL